jgi:hypothetical protein
MNKKNNKAITLFSLLTVLIAFLFPQLPHSQLLSIMKKLRTIFLHDMLNH